MGWRGPVATGGAAIVLLAAGSQVQQWLPGEHDDPASEPFVRTGAVGDEIDLRTGVLVVDEVSGAKAVLDFGDEEVSPGLWVLVDYTFTAAGENTAITFAEARDADGRTWTMTGRNTNTCDASPPGVPVHCSVLFEVPPDALPSLTLSLARLSKDTRYDVVAEVELGLTAADADEFATAEPLEPPPLATLGGGS